MPAINAKPVCVVIVNYNTGLKLTKCVRSVLRSSVPVEVYISDNGSKDSSVGYLRAVVGPHPCLTIIENGENLGFARGNNVALAHCRGDYVLFLNPDCFIQPDTIERMLAAMESDPLAGMAGCLIRNPDGSEQAGCRRFIPTPWRALVRVLKLSRMFRRHPQFSSFILTGQPLPDRPTPVEAISGAFMFVRSSAMQRVGLMDEGYFLHCEDLDWCMRFRQAGFTILFVPHAEIVHTKGGSGSDPVLVEWHKHKGMIRFYRKFFRRRYPSPLLYLVILAVWARFAVIAVKCTVKRSAATGNGFVGARPEESAPVANEYRHDRPGVIITGATSQIGGFLSPRLVEAGYVVHAISRKSPYDSGAMNPSLIWHRLDIIRDVNGLKEIEGATVLIHLAPLVTLPHLIDAAAHAGIRRIVAFGSTSRYSKLRSTDRKEQQWVADLIEAEEALERKCAAHGIAWTVFRPTLIYGRGTDKNVSVIAGFIRRFGFFPMVGEGKGLRRPVHADDLAAACITALNCPATINRAYNLSGGEAITYRQMVEEIFNGLGKKPRIIRIPVELFRVLLRAAALLPAYRHLNFEMVVRINLDLDFDHLAASRDFGYAPRKFMFPVDLARHQDVRQPAANV